MTQLNTMKLAVETGLTDRTSEQASSVRATEDRTRELHDMAKQLTRDAEREVCELVNDLYTLSDLRHHHSLPAHCLPHFSHHYTADQAARFGRAYGVDAAGAAVPTRSRSTDVKGRVCPCSAPPRAPGDGTIAGHGRRGQPTQRPPH